MALNDLNRKTVVQWLLKPEVSELLDDLDIDGLYEAFSDISTRTGVQPNFLTYMLEQELNIDILKNISIIRRYMFYTLPRDNVLNIPDNIRGKIGGYAFSSCDGLEEVNIGSGVTATGELLFSRCKDLKKLTIPDTVSSIGWGTCSECSSLEEVRLSKCMSVSLQPNVFESCTSLKQIVIPDCIKIIGSKAFYHCTALESVKFPRYVKQIQEHAFDECVSLKEIKLPATVNSIDKYAFANCNTLSKVYYAGTKEQWKKVARGARWYSNYIYVQCKDGHFEYKRKD